MVTLTRAAAFAAAAGIVSSQQCEGNNPSFRDEEGYSCEDWENWPCEDAMKQWSYSWQGQSALLKNCCETCAENRKQCIDDDDFEDEQGYGCKDWFGYDCYTALSEWDYSVKGLVELLNNCKRQCKSCAYKTEGEGNCKDDLEFIDEKGWCCGHWQEYNCGRAHAFWGYSVEGEQELRTKCQYSCETCGYHKCEDNPEFEDEEGYRCGEWKGYNCEEAVSEWEYSKEGQEGLINACPHTCGTCDQDNQDDKTDAPKNTEPPTDLLSFEAYQSFCGEQTEEKDCKDFGCKYKNKRGEVSCFQKKAKAVKCKKVKDFSTCLAIGCTVNDKLKCIGKPNFQ